MIPNTSAKFDFRVTYEPSWLPATGHSDAAFLRSANMAEGDLIIGLVEYASNMK
jgi:hypothetical protein